MTIPTEISDWLDPALMRQWTSRLEEMEASTSPTVFQVLRKVFHLLIPLLVLI